MYAKRSGSAILSSMVFLAIASIFGTIFFKSAQNNIKMQEVSDLELDVYDISRKEEKVLKDFMDEINSEYEEAEIFNENFNIQENENEISYVKSEDIFLLKYKNEEEIVRERKINYEIKNNKIILIPTYTFKNMNKKLKNG